MQLNRKQENNIKLNNVYTGKMYYLFLNYRYSQYLLLISIVTLFLQYYLIHKYILGYVITTFFLLNVVITRLVMYRIRNKYKVIVKFTEKEVSISDINIPNIKSVKMYFESYYGRSSISFWIEPGYNRLIIRTVNQNLFFVFQISDISMFQKLIESVKKLNQKSNYIFQYRRLYIFW